MSTFTPRPDGVEFAIRLVPRAREDRVEGLHGDALKIRLRAPPVDGKANAALLRFLADTLALPMSRIALIAGETSRNKRVRVTGIRAATAEARLLGNS
ncbi:MAG: DUF167 family protein [Lentisphaerae bacterium]|nr:DUF167 family protein [Lentisphaerota bacterium]